MSASSSSNGFVAGLAEHEVRYQVCAACGHVQTLARLACRSCGASRLEWRRAAGTGAVFAVTVVSRAPSEEFRALAPYTLVLVDLDEGCRIMGHAAPGVMIGQRVVADFFEHGGRTLLRFRPP